MNGFLTKLPQALLACRASVSRLYSSLEARVYLAELVTKVPGFSVRLLVRVNPRKIDTRLCAKNRAVLQKVERSLTEINGMNGKVIPENFGLDNRGS